MGVIVLGIGDLAATNREEEAIKTYALGSCVAVVVLDPVSRSIGMDHIALPDSSVNPEKAKDKPGHFANTGIPALLQAMKIRGWNGNSKQLIIKLVGGANVMDHKNTFNIGKRNVLAIKKTLWQFSMGAIAEDVGGNISRTVTVDAQEGKIIISSPGRENWQI